MILPKSKVILKLQEFGFKARYSNICWFYNSNFIPVGGMIYLNNHSKVYFRVDHCYESVDIVEGYDDIHDLIFGIDEGD